MTYPQVFRKNRKVSEGDIFTADSVSGYIERESWTFVANLTETVPTSAESPQQPKEQERREDSVDEKKTKKEKKEKKGKECLQQFRFLGNCPPTAPLSYH